MGVLWNFKRGQSCSDNLKMEQDQERRNSEDDSGETYLIMKWAWSVEVGGDHCKLAVSYHGSFKTPCCRVITEREEKICLPGIGHGVMAGAFFPY